MRTTVLHINAIVGISLLAGLSALLIFNGEYCGGVGVAGGIAPVAMHFAKQSNGH